MNVESVIDKLQKIAREKEAQRLTHKRREYAKEEDKVLRRRESVGMLNIQPMAMISPPQSLSSLKCEEGKQYHAKMQFAHSIIQNIYRLGSYVVEFMRR
jgi:hypothetical protein